MDSKAPSQSEVYPKVYLSTSSGSSSSPSSAFPIRAPPTVDSDSEFSIPTNGQKSNYSSSSTYGSDSGFESEGFLSGEDGFETASERPVVADPDDEMINDGDFVENPVGFRAFVGDPFGEIKVNVISRALVGDRDEETIATPMKKEDNYGRSIESSVLDIGISAIRIPDIPIAMLSRESDEDSVVSEEVEDNGFLSSVRVPDIGILERTDSVIRVKVSGDEEEDESELEPELDVEVDQDSEKLVIYKPATSEGSITVNDYVSENFLGRNEDKSLDDVEGAIIDKPEINEIGIYSEGEIRGFGRMEQRETERRSRSLEGHNAFDLGDRTQMDKVIGCEHERKVLEDTEIIASGIGISGAQIDETKCTILMENMEESEAFVMGSDIANDTSDKMKDSKLLEADATAVQEVEHGLPTVTLKGNMQERELIFTEMERDNLWVELETGLHSPTDFLDPPYLHSNSNLDIEPEVEDKAVYHPDNPESLISVDDSSKRFVCGLSDTTKISMEDIEQKLFPTSLGESSQDIFEGVERTILGDSNVEKDTDEGSEGNEIFYSTIDSSTSANSPRPAIPSNHHRLLTTSEIMGWESGNKYVENISEEERRKLEKIQLLRVKFLRLVHRLGLSPEDPTASQVLYRLVLAAGWPSNRNFSLELAKRTALELEAEKGKNDLDFFLNIMVIGKTGVGKSATINSIFCEEKSSISAFEPATAKVKAIVGTINDIKVRIFDTPGLRPSLMEQSFNRKILLSIKKLTKRCPPDIVLYVDRLDTQTRDLNDLPLLRSITNFLGSSIWENSIVTLTHAGSTPPDGPSGSPLSYDLYVAQRSRTIHQLISQSVGHPWVLNPSLVSPVSLVENHSLCQKIENGEKLLPNGETWRPHLLLLCSSVKILSEANLVAKIQDLFNHQKVFGLKGRSLSLPYLLSSLLQSHTHLKLPSELGGYDSDIELDFLSDSDLENDEYDQLPPFKPLKKTQIAKLTKEQKKAYFEEYDYRVRLLQKKQWKEEIKRKMEKRGKNGENTFMEEDRNEETGTPSAVTIPLPDMSLPLSFDVDNPNYRYRHLEPTSQVLLTRPVLDVHSWDHDCGYDGVSIESNIAITNRVPAMIAVQITKGKKDFNLHFDSSISAKHGENGSTVAALDIQTAGKQIAYIFKSETKVKNCKMNKTAAGFSITLLGENASSGLKIGDQYSVGKRLVLAGSTGAVHSQGDTAYGANFEVRVREKDYPIGQDESTVNLSIMRCRGELVWSGHLQSEFSVGQSSKMVFQAGVNNKLSGQVSIKTSSSDQLQIAVLGVLPIANAIARNFFPWFREKYLTR